MRYIKFIIAALLSLLNVWLCSRTLDSNFNPMAFLGLIIYSFNACDLIYMLLKLCLETAITFAIFYGFFRNKVRNKKLYLFEIISCCVLPCHGGRCHSHPDRCDSIPDDVQTAPYRHPAR